MRPPSLRTSSSDDTSVAIPKVMYDVANMFIVAQIVVISTVLFLVSAVREAEAIRRHGARGLARELGLDYQDETGRRCCRKESP